MGTLVVTGATGRLGGRVAGRLAAAGIGQKLVVRDPARAPDLSKAEVVTATYGDFAAVRRALAGDDIVFMVSGAEALDRVAQHRTFIDAAVAAGIAHLVYTSFVGAGPASRFTLARDHGATEEHLRGSGLSFTVLRDNLYADFLPLMIGADGVIRGPAGHGRVAAVALDDVADVAAAILRSPAAHRNATDDLTGPEAFTLAEAAATISAATGRSVTYQPETLAQAYASRAAFGAPDWQVEAWVSTYTAIAARDLAEVSDAVPRLAGHPATSLAGLLRRGPRPGSTAQDGSGPSR